MDGSTARLVVAVLIMVAAAVVAEVVRRRRRSDPPTQPRHQVPRQLDRADFAEAVAADWLVAVFTSDTCSSCADVARKADVLRSASVGVTVVSYQGRPELHRRYGIEAVPCVLVADRAGVVVDHVIGPVTATDLWATVAEARSPGSVRDGRACGD